MTKFVDDGISTDKGHEFPNRLDKLGIELPYRSLPWVGVQRFQYFMNATEEAVRSDNKPMPLYLDLTPVCLGVNVAGDKVAMIMADHTVRFSMN